LKDHPLYKVSAGAAMMGVAFIAACFTLITDESLIQGGNGNVPLSWDVFCQPWNLIMGQYSGIFAWSVIGAWMIFCAYVTLSVIDHFGTDKTMKTAVWILVTIDGIGNFLYFKGIPFVYQSLLTGLVFFSLVYGGKRGTSLFFAGISEFSALRRSRYVEEDD
jgi:hypothetical protein